MNRPRARPVSPPVSLDPSIESQRKISEARLQPHGVAVPSETGFLDAL